MSNEKRLQALEKLPDLKRRRTHKEIIIFTSCKTENPVIVSGILTALKRSFFNPTYSPLNCKRHKGDNFQLQQTLKVAVGNQLNTEFDTMELSEASNRANKF